MADKTSAAKEAERKATKKGPTDMYEGTLRVVTIEDVEDDPRVVAAGAVVGQLYDFSNLPFVKDNALEDEVEEKNEIKADLAEKGDEGHIRQAPSHTSEVERRQMGIENPEEKPAREETVR